MLRYFIMKKKEIELKLKLYTYLLDFLHGKEEMIACITKLITALQEVPAEDFKNQFVEAIAEQIHAQALKEKTDKPTDSSI